ncbi:hypothetical protein B7463_g8462, partial [Scytalidium lignicola]
MFTTASKDHTRVLAALILSLEGTIANDYALTRIGVELAREPLLDSILAQTGLKLDQAGMLEICSTSTGSMMKFIDMVNNKWGGIERLMEKELGLAAK